MPDYTVHLQRNYDWWEQYETILGWYPLLEYADRVYDLFRQIRPGQFFDVARNVAEANRDLFIKLCCMYIDESSRNPLHPDSFYEFSADCTLLRNVKRNT